MKLFDTIQSRIANNPQFDRSNIDKTFWFMYFALFLVALVALFSASATLVYRTGSAFGPVGHQCFFLILGAVGAWVVQFISSDTITRWSRYILYVLIGMLFIMLVPHNPFVMSVNGAGRWFRLFGVSFQPSEFAKVALVIVVADILAKAKTPEEMKQAFKQTFILAALTIFPIFVGNLSTALLMGIIVFLLWFIARVDWRYLVATIGIMFTLLISGYFLVEYAFIRPGNRLPGLFGRATVWVARVDALLSEKADEADGKTFVLDDDNYQRSLAKVAVARGGKTPFGVGPGNSQERNYLPLAYADYIFAIIVEETGFMGALGLIFIYMTILFRACLVSSKFGDVRAMLITMGLALMLTTQTFISMAVAVGLGPVTGQPLPMITMGGTSSLATALYFGVMMAVSREQNQIKNNLQSVQEESLNDIPDLE